jgi:hypothetical protein
MANLLVAGNSTNGGTAISTDTSGTLNIVTGSGAGANAISVDTSQNVGVGTTSPSTYGKLAVVAPASQYCAAYLAANTSGTYYHTSFYNDTTQIGYQYSEGTNFGLAAVGASAGIVFLANGSERVRINSGGNLLVGTSSINGLVTSSQSATSTPSVAPRATSTSFASDVLQIYCARDTNNASYNYITAARPAGTSFIVRDSGNVLNANNSYGAISDQSLKENIADATPKLEKLNQVRIVNFNMIGDDQKQIGVVAQELEQIFPSMVEEDQEGTKSVKYSVFVPMLIKAIQELKAELDALKAKVGE